MGFAYQPVLRGILSPEKLVNGDVDIVQLFILHDLMEIQAENEARINKFYADKAKRGK